jgi:hypothetical protein
MTGRLYYDEIENIWYVNWMNNPEMYPSISLGGRIKLHPDDVEVIDIYQMYMGKDDTLSNKEVEYANLDGCAKLIEPGTNYDPLYGKIEKEIIEWSNDGTKTAGELTRKIMELIKK